MRTSVRLYLRYAKGKPLADDVDLHEVALSTVGFTGADLANLLNEAALMTARHSKTKITMQEISDATFRVQMGPQKNSKKLTDKVKETYSLRGRTCRSAQGNV